RTARPAAARRSTSPTATRPRPSHLPRRRSSPTSPSHPWRSPLLPPSPPLVLRSPPLVLRSPPLVLRSPPCRRGPSQNLHRPLSPRRRPGANPHPLQPPHPPP